MTGRLTLDDLIRGRQCRSSAAMMCLLAGLSVALHAAEPGYRTDGGDENLPWFQLQPGAFPPEGSAHSLSGELIAVDHVMRTGVLRLDRTDAQLRKNWDMPLPFVLLPYGSVRYHGARASLRDIPIGTHLQGQFYREDEDTVDRLSEQPTYGRMPSVQERGFTRVLQLEDDFSFFARQHRAWRVDAVSASAGDVTVTPSLRDQGDPHAQPVTFAISATTRVWKGRCIGSLSDIAPGQTVQINLTACTIEGPGHCADVWLDEESREVAVAHQLEKHREYLRPRGLAGWVDEVDNHRGIVTVTLFDDADAELTGLFAVNDLIRIAVADDSLRTWEQTSDAIKGTITEVLPVSPGPGNSGVRLKLQPTVLLEGFRPTRIVRLFPSAWKVERLPLEEQLYVSPHHLR